MTGSTNIIVVPDKTEEKSIKSNCPTNNEHEQI